MILAVYRVFYHIDDKRLKGNGEGNYWREQ